MLAFSIGWLFQLNSTMTPAQTGLAAMAFGERPHYLLHLVYGVFATVFLPGVYAYTSRGVRDREAVLLAAACWIVLVAYGRGYMTGLVR